MSIENLLKDPAVKQRLLEALRAEGVLMEPKDRTQTATKKYQCSVTTIYTCKLCRSRTQVTHKATTNNPSTINIQRDANRAWCEMCIDALNSKTKDELLSLIMRIVKADPAW